MQCSMETINNLIDSLKDLKPSLFLTITIFIIGMIVPGACGLAIYDIDFFKEIDIFRLIFLSIGIGSPSILISLFMFLEPETNIPDSKSIELIFLIAGFISIFSFILITSLIHFFNNFLNHTYLTIEGYYMILVLLMLTYSYVNSYFKVKKYRKNQNNSTQTSNGTPPASEQNS